MSSEAGLDLSALERAAASAGLPGLRARVVPPDARRGTWFRWRGAELDVSESVLERCPPDDAAALLVMTVCERRRLDVLRRRLVIAAIAAIVAVAAVADAAGTVPAVVSVALAVVALVAHGAHARGAIFRAADDEAVALLGDAQPLVRGLNRMNQEELVVGSMRVPARPDLHGRAERLIRIHRLLCESPADGAT